MPIYSDLRTKLHSFCPLDQQLLQQMLTAVVQFEVIYWVAPGWNGAWCTELGNPQGVERALQAFTHFEMIMLHNLADGSAWRSKWGLQSCIFSHLFLFISSSLVAVIKHLERKCRFRPPDNSAGLQCTHLVFRSPLTRILSLVPAFLFKKRQLTY